MTDTVRIIVSGLGNLGLRFTGIIAEKQEYLHDRYGLDLVIVGAADSRGTAYDPAGLNPRTIIRVKQEAGSVGNYPNAGRPGATAGELITAAAADVLCEATPVNLGSNGEPGLSHVTAALSHGIHVVTPNKGPIVLAYAELTALAREHDVELRFDGTVAGGLPAIPIGARDLRGAHIERIEAVPNLVTGYIIDLLTAGLDWDVALARAQETGALEADPSWDIDGWDAAAKLVILVNSVLGVPAKLDDVDRAGVRGISSRELEDAAAAGKKVRLLATAEDTPSGYRLRVAPQPIPSDHPLGRLGDREMGIVYYTDIYGTITATIREESPIPSAATMLRDIIAIYRPQY